MIDIIYLVDDLTSVAEIISVFVVVLTLLIGSLIGVLWKFVISRIDKNKCDIDNLYNRIDKRIESVNKNRKEDLEMIKEFIRKSTQLGSDESELLIRIDERVNDIRNDLNKVKEQVDELYKKNGGDEKK